MFNDKFFAVFKREIRDRLLSKSFLIMTFLVPVFLIGILAFQTFVMSYEDSSKINVVFLTDQKVILEELPKILVKDNKFTYQYQVMDSLKFNDYLKSKNEDITSEKITGVFIINAASLKDKEINFYSKNPKNEKLFQKIRSSINNIMLKEYYKDKKIDNKELQYAMKDVSVNDFRVSKEGNVEKAGYGNMILSFLFSFFLYFSLVMIGTQILRSVVEEKANKIVEVLLSSMNSFDLMTGKIIGVAVTGVIQMAIWMLPIVFVTSTTIFVLPPELVLSITPGQILYILFNYFIGLITFLGLFASVGAMFDNDQDAQQGMWPVLMLILLPFFIGIAQMSNPENAIARITSMVPFFSIIVMPSRIAMADVPTIQIVAAVVINLITMWLIFKLSAKIFRVGILMTGKKPTISEIIKWVRR